MAKRTGRAFTMIELLVVLVVIALLSAVLIPALSNAKAKARRIWCANHLANVGLAHRIFATDHAELFAWERALSEETNRMNFPDLTGLTPEDKIIKIYQTLSNELSTPKILACPADTRKPAVNWLTLTTNNISYFVGLSARESSPQTLMAGDRNLVLDGNKVAGRVELKVGMAVVWDQSIHRFQGSVTMGDGSVQQLSLARLKEVLANTGVETNVVLIP